MTDGRGVGVDLLAACWTSAGDVVPFRGLLTSRLDVRDRIAAVAAAGYTGFGLTRADLVVAVTGDDEDNLLICQVAKEKYLCERIIARCNNPRNLAHFKLLGIQPAVSATDLILLLYTLRRVVRANGAY